VNAVGGEIHAMNSLGESRSGGVLPILPTQPGPAICEDVWRRRGILSTARVRPPAPQLELWMAQPLSMVLEDTFDGADLTEPVKFDPVPMKGC